MTMTHKKKKCIPTRPLFFFCFVKSEWQVNGALRNPDMFGGQEVKLLLESHKKTSSTNLHSMELVLRVRIRQKAEMTDA